MLMNKPPSKNKMKHNAMVVFTAMMLGISNSYNSEEKALSDFEVKEKLIEIEKQSSSAMPHPNLLWNPKFYVQSLMNKIIWWN